MGRDEEKKKSLSQPSPLGRGGREEGRQKAGARSRGDYTKTR